jgi:hypothetical protein
LTVLPPPTHTQSHIVNLPAFLNDKEALRNLYCALECAGVALGPESLATLLGKRDAGVGGYAQLAAAGLAAVPARVR